MKKTEKQSQEQLEVVESFSQVFDSMEDELLVEMAMYYPQQLRDLCIFLTLDRQMAEEELQQQGVAFYN
jgi:DNA-directed RNA polymerase subunit F